MSETSSVAPVGFCRAEKGELPEITPQTLQHLCESTLVALTLCRFLWCMQSTITSAIYEAEVDFNFARVSFDTTLHLLLKDRLRRSDIDAVIQPVADDWNKWAADYNAEAGALKGRLLVGGMCCFCTCGIVLFSTIKKLQAIKQRHEVELQDEMWARSRKLVSDLNEQRFLPQGVQVRLHAANVQTLTTTGAGSSRRVQTVHLKVPRFEFVLGEAPQPFPSAPTQMKW